jgi:hypothetical protein
MDKRLQIFEICSYLWHQTQIVVRNYTFVFRSRPIHNKVILIQELETKSRIRAFVPKRDGIADHNGRAA